MPESSTPRYPPAGPDSVLADILAWRDQGKRVWLCTIVGTWGSSPRPRGSWLAVSEAGDWSGSVSGGCLEEDLLRRTASDWPERPLVVDYGITDDDRDRFSLPCGGRIRLLVEPVSSLGVEDHIHALAQALEQRQPVTRAVSSWMGSRNCCGPDTAAVPWCSLTVSACIMYWNRIAGCC